MVNVNKPCAWCNETSARIDSLEHLEEESARLTRENIALKRLERELRDQLVKRLLPKDRG